MIQTVRTQITQAMREKNTLKRDVLRVLLGELQTAEARAGSISDEDGQQVVRKMLKSSEETLGLTSDGEARQRFEGEIAILQSLLPRTMSVEEIVAALDPVAEQIRAAGNDGQATGIAMKHLKGQGASVEGKDVAQAVKQMRG